jgi:predicted PurR-regulated permease PerM
MALAGVTGALGYMVARLISQFDSLVEWTKVHDKQDAERQVRLEHDITQLHDRQDVNTAKIESLEERNRRIDEEASKRHK